MKYNCYREGNITIFGGIQHFSGQRNTIILFVILFKNRKLNQSIRRNKMRITQFIQKYSLVEGQSFATISPCLSIRV